MRVPWPRPRTSTPRLSRSPGSLRDTAWAEPRRVSRCRQRPPGPRPSGPGNLAPSRRTPPKHCCQEANSCYKPLMRLPKKSPARSGAPKDPAQEVNPPRAPSRDPRGSPIHRGSCGLGGGPPGSLEGLVPEAPWARGFRQPRTSGLASGPSAGGFSSTEPWHIAIILLPGIPGSTERLHKAHAQASKAAGAAGPYSPWGKSP